MSSAKVVLDRAYQSLLTRDFTKAYDRIELVDILDNNNEIDYLIVGENCLFYGAYNEAELAFQIANRREPFCDDSLMALGNAMYLNDKYEETISLFSDYLKKHPKNIGALMLTAYAYLGLEDYEHANNIFQKIVDAPLQTRVTTFYNSSDRSKRIKELKNRDDELYYIVESLKGLSTTKWKLGNKKDAIIAYVELFIFQITLNLVKYID